MSNKNINDLENYFKEIYPWMIERYNFLYERRITDIQKNFNNLIILDSLLVILLLEFAKVLGKGSLIFYIPILFLIIPIFLFFFYILPRQKIWFPWFEKKDIKNIFFENKDFYEEGIKSIYGTTNHLFWYAQKRKDLYNVSLNFLLIAISSPFVIFFSSIGSYCLSFIFLFLFFGIIMHLNLQRNKENVPENPSKKAEEFFNEWKKEILENNKKN